MKSRPKMSLIDWSGDVGLVIGQRKLVFLSVLVGASLLAACSDEAAQRDSENCRLLQEGMTDAEVREIMGPPVNRVWLNREPGQPRIMMWNYRELATADGPISVYLVETGAGLELKRANCFLLQ